MKGKYRSEHFNRIEHTGIRRMIAVLLCICTLIPIFQAKTTTTAFAAEEIDAVKITYEGEAVKELTLPQDERMTVKAEYAAGTSEVTYQWQILADIQSDFWVDIYDGKEQTLALSYSMLVSLLDDADGAYVRCKVTDGENAVYSDGVWVTVTYTDQMETVPEAVVTPQTTAKKAPMRAPKAGSEYVDISINYLDAITGREVFTKFKAQIAKGSTYTNNVISPTLLGYAAYYNKLTPSIEIPKDGKTEVYAPDDATMINLNIDVNYKEDTYVINVYYKAIDVPYGIRYFFQNINDDQYTEHTGLYTSKKAKTGTIISDEELKLKNSEGYTKLYHYPEAVAADGSTVFQCYYDRNYYMLKFDMDGGYGTDPIYARYGTPFVVTDPIRHGYVFKGWADVTDNPESTEKVTLPATVPAANKSYKAIWEVATTHYTKVYWLQNADNDEYSYVGSVTMNNVNSGDKVSGENDLQEDTPVCNNSEVGHTHNDNCYPTDFKYYVYDHADSNVTVSGDGSTIVNIYYKRREYNLNFYYAREKTDGTVEIVGGTTYPFGNINQTEPTSYTIDNLLKQVADSQWGKVKSLPTIHADYASVYGEPKTLEANGYTYYYLTLHGRYGEDISDKWPGTVFDKVEIDRTNINPKKNNNKDDGEWKKYAYLAGWNGEFRVKYTKEHSNSTIKGMFQKLDEELLRQDDATIIEVNFLGFFDNGADIGWSFPYQWIYELYVPAMEGDTGDLLHEGVYYKKIKSIDTVDNNEGIEHQTQPTLNGFKNANRVLVNNGTYTDDGRRSYTAQFFYTRNNYTIDYHNYGSIVHTQPNVPFETSLKEYIAREPKYPETLEKGAYEFGGWYYTAECYEGTKCKDTDTMPANDIALYAKWKPVTYTVNFFQTYDDMIKYDPNATQTTDLYATGQVEHGKVLEMEVTVPTDQTGNKYTFSGWFYIENGKKKAYTPSETPVTSNLNVFADWGSHTAQPYKVHYALYEKETDQTWLKLLNTVAGTSPSDNKSYTVTNGSETRNYVYLASDKGYHLQIADDASGFAYQGNTRTFYAKAGAPYNQLYDTYDTGYYPTVASHSISIEEDNKEEPVKNVYTFTYVHADKVEYTVEYHYAETNELIKGVGDNGSGKKVVSSTNAVVTERFAVVSGYIPDAFYKRLILAVQVDETGKFVSSPDNKIVFYYTKNEENAYYAVHYMLQNLNTTSEGFEKDTNGNYINYTESDAHTEGIAKINSSQKIIAQKFDGFTFKNTAKAYDASGENEKDKDLKTLTDGTNYFEVNIRKEGTEIYIFYTRNTQNYKVYYLKYGTNTDNLDSLKFDENDSTHANGVLAQTTSGSGKFGATVTANAEKIDGMNCVSNTTQKLELRADDKLNNIFFYYSPLQYQAEYHVWSQGGGTLSSTIEVKEGENEFIGSVPKADSGYKFDGWYTDEDCKTKVTEDQARIETSSNRLTPEKSKMKPKPEITKFYAKFSPILGDLTIERTGANDEGYGSQIFTYRITATDDPSFEMFVSIQGDDSVTIKDMLCKEYKIEQQNDWSWRYGDISQTITLEEKQTKTVTFSIAPAKDKWLNGNSNKLVNRKG